MPHNPARLNPHPPLPPLSLNFPLGIKLDRTNSAGGAFAIKAAFDAARGQSMRDFLNE
jgi:hypothetical protein